MVASGGLVTQWSDVSGNARHLVQATGSKRPSLVVGDANGFQVASFDGSDDYLQAAGADLFALEYTIAIVVKSGAATGGVFMSLSTSSTGMYLRQSASRTIGSINVNEAVDAATSTSAYQLWYVERTDTGPLVTLEINGSSQSLTNDDMGLAAPSSAKLTLGAANRASVDLNAACKIAEVVICDAVLSSADKASLTHYLRAKFGV